MEIEVSFNYLGKTYKGKLKVYFETKKSIDCYFYLQNGKGEYVRYGDFLYSTITCRLMTDKGMFPEIAEQLKKQVPYSFPDERWFLHQIL
ncbi:MAG: hypothetical protein BGN92_07125 [Sphingobacteriales bacterium 41-5]|nr:MAG: hypothetical protein BGN92_07125 [Sphingobacteriales bacterium 41-5]